MTCQSGVCVCVFTVYFLNQVLSNPTTAISSIRWVSLGLLNP